MVKSKSRGIFSIAIIIAFLAVPVVTSLGHPIEMMVELFTSIIAVFIVWKVNPVAFPVFFPFAIACVTVVVRLASFYFYGIPLNR